MPALLSLILTLVATVAPPIIAMITPHLGAPVATVLSGIASTIGSIYHLYQPKPL